MTPGCGVQMTKLGYRTCDKHAQISTSLKLENNQFRSRISSGGKSRVPRGGFTSIKPTEFAFSCFGMSDAVPVLPALVLTNLGEGSRSKKLRLPQILGKPMDTLIDSTRRDIIAPWQTEILVKHIPAMAADSLTAKTIAAETMSLLLCPRSHERPSLSSGRGLVRSLQYTPPWKNVSGAVMGPL